MEKKITKEEISQHLRTLYKQYLKNFPEGEASQKEYDERANKGNEVFLALLLIEKELLKSRQSLVEMLMPLEHEENIKSFNIMKEEINKKK